MSSDQHQHKDRYACAFGQEFPVASSFAIRKHTRTSSINMIIVKLRDGLLCFVSNPQETDQR